MCFIDYHFCASHLDVDRVHLSDIARGVDPQVDLIPSFVMLYFIGCFSPTNT